MHCRHKALTGHFRLESIELVAPPNKALQPTPESYRAAFGGSSPGRRG